MFNLGDCLRHGPVFSPPLFMVKTKWQERSTKCCYYTLSFLYRFVLKGNSVRTIT